MRVPHIIAGLLGLAGLAVAAPTSKSAAVQLIESTQVTTRSPDCTTAEPEKWLITICGNHTISNSVPKDGLNACWPLTGLVAYEVTGTIQADGLICCFYDDSDYCNGDFVIATMTHHAKIPTALGKRIRYVLCKKASQRRDAVEVEGRDVDTPSNQLTQTDITEVATSATKEPLIATIFSGTTNVAVSDRSAGLCVKLNDRIAHDVTHTAQRDNAICRYFESGCGINPLITVTTRGRYIDKPIPSDIGEKITHVMCGDSHAPGEIEAREENASSAVAIHTAVDSAAEYTTHMYAGFIVASIETSALGQCYKLPNEVIKQVTWIEQPQGYVCKYYRHDCQDIKMLRTLDSRPSRWSNPIETGLGTQIEYAMCKRTFDKRDVSVSSDDMDDSGFKQLPPLEHGKLRVGENYEGKRFRQVINALDTCVILPGTMFPNSTRFLEQAGRSECSYYTKTECTGDPILGTRNPDEKDWQLRSDFARQINAANCTLFTGPIPPPPATEQSTSTARIQVRAKALPHVNAKDIKVTVGHSLSALKTPFLKVGDLYICADNRPSGGCTLLHTLNQCIAFSGPFAHQTKLITQAKGSFCKYYTKPGCMDGDEYFRYMSNPKQDAELSGWGVGKLAGVWCGGTGAAALTPSIASTASTASVDVNAIDAPSNDKRDATLTARSNPFYHWDVSPGSTSVCHQRYWAFCTNNRINAIQQCANFAPADQGPASIIQYIGAYCKWYRDFGCGSGEDKWPRIVDSRAGQVWVDGLLEGKKPDRFKSVKCETYPW